MRRPFDLDTDPSAGFPPADTALRDPDGLLAVGGDLHPERLLSAYRNGIFPWFNPGETILWWSPDPRTVFDTANFRFSRGNRRSLSHAAHWTLAINTHFREVITQCAAVPRAGQRGTWITNEMRQAYTRLHTLGYAHCASVHNGDTLVGGIYGVAIGQMFYGESMFSMRPGASKLALAGLCHHLARAGFPLLDAQVNNSHLQLLGARPLARSEFIQKIQQLASTQPPLKTWQPQSGLPVDHLLA